MSNHPIIEALRAALESERKEIAETRAFAKGNAHTLRSEPAWHYTLEDTTAGHEAATERLMTILEQAIDNLEAVLKYTHHSTDVWLEPSIYNTPANTLKLAAKKIEEKDCAVLKAREFLSSLKDPK